jgi:multidrug resistance efflux pump
MASVCLALGLMSACTPRTRAEATNRAQPVLALHRGELTRRLLLTGELDAVFAEQLSVPRTPQWNVSLRWLERDGASVRAGQTVAELDNTAFAADLAERKLSATRVKNDLEHQVTGDAVITADRTFEVEKARIALAKARLQAGVAPDTIARRAYQEKQLALARAEVAFATATDNLRAHLESAALEVKVRSIELGKAERAIQAAERSIKALVLVAPRDGIVNVATHPWWGRKLEMGDNLWVGLPVARLPDLSSMQVNALASDVDDGQLRVGMPVRAVLDAYPNEPFEGTITELSPVARAPSQGSERRFFRVTVALAKTDPARMRPGMSVRVEVDVDRREASWIAPRVSLDLREEPARLHLSNGTTARVRAVSCNLQSCAVEPEGAAESALAEGVALRVVPGGGA